MNHSHIPFTPHYIFKGIPESCSSVMSGILLFTSSRFIIFLSACALLTRVASAPAVQFYAMPGEFGYKNCPPWLHAARVGIKKPRCVCIVVKRVYQQERGTASEPFPIDWHLAGVAFSCISQGKALVVTSGVWLPRN